MPKTHQYRVVDSSFLDTAPIRGALRQRIPASAAATFRSFEDADAWPLWLDPVTKIEWTSPQPFGVGTTRDITIRGRVVSETFYTWDDGTRMSFYFASGQLPLFAAFAEDYELVPVGTYECELVWRYGFECVGAFKLVQSLIGFGFERAAMKSLVQLGDYMAANRGRYDM